MDYLTEFLPSNNMVALIIASLIFIVTAALVAKKLISFLITIVLLCFAIASGMAIANNDLVRDYFSQKTAERPPVVTTPQTPVVEQPEPDTKKIADETIDQVREELVKILNQLATLLSSDGQKNEKKPEYNPPAPQSDSERR